jgi:predicted DNA-binding transcriptional regulator AlpA
MPERATPADLASLKLVDAKQLKEIFAGYSDNAIDRMINDPVADPPFPKPVKSRRKRMWFLSELAGYQAALVAKRNADLEAKRIAKELQERAASQPVARHRPNNN